MRRPDATFCDQLRRYRARAGLTQEELAERAGLAAATIGALERGVRRLPFMHTRRRLAEALELSAIEQAAFVDPQPSRAVGPPASNLPVPRVPLLGRAHALAALRALLLAEGADGARLVTLSGVGGCGKTRLALQLAIDLQAGSAFPGGVWLAELAPTTDPALIAQAVAAALGVEEAPGAPLLTTLSARLRQRPLLLVLDNCEHLVEACALLAEHLLATCPELRILATSREPLQVTGEQQWRVPPLLAPEFDDRVSLVELAEYPAVQLFVARARAVAAGFELTEENAATVGQICARLDGLPLAIELAAVRVRVLGVGQILKRLGDAIHLLSGNSRVVASRQQTLQAAMDWSHSLLGEAERTLFRRLAVFAGGFELEAAEQVTGNRMEVLDLLTQLVDKSLVQVEPGADSARYRLLELVRQYAAQQLATSGETEMVRTRHAEHFLALAEQAAPKLRGSEQAAWLDRLDANEANLRSALSWAEACAEAPIGLRLAVALTSFWEGRGHLSEGRRWFARLLAMPSVATVPISLRLAALLGAGRLAQWHGDLEEAAALFTQCLSGARELGDQQVIADALTWLAAVRRRQRRVTEAAALLEESTPLLRALDDEWGTAFALLNQGLLTGDISHEHAAGRPFLEEALLRYRRLGDVRCIALTCTLLGATLTFLGEHARAADLLHEGLARFQEVGDRTFVLYGLITLAMAAGQMGQPELAARLLGATEAHLDSLGASLAPVNQVSQGVALAEIRTGLSEAEIAAAWSAGRSLDLDQLIAEAMTVGSGAATSEPRAGAAPPPGMHERLTRREGEVTQLLIQGYTDAEIAAALGIGVRTVGTHVQHILAKLAVHSRWQVTDLAMAEGLGEREHG